MKMWKTVLLTVVAVLCIGALPSSDARAECNEAGWDETCLYFCDRQFETESDIANNNYIFCVYVYFYEESHCYQQLQAAMRTIYREYADCEDTCRC